LKEKMRAMNDAGIVAEFTGSVGDIISGVVQQGRDANIIYVDLGRVEGKVPLNEQVVQQGRDANIIYVDLGRVEGKVPLNEQVPTEHFKHGDRIKAYVVDVRQGEKGPEVTLSRTHPMFVKMLFTLEVPELKDRVVEIIGVSREPGQRSKVSVRSNRAGVSPKGALIGPMGARSKAVTDELHGEKIDIVDFSEDPALYVASALAPARVTSVEIVDLEAKSAKVIVPDFQLSLAIGKDGQNVRLAVKLTGWRMDIHPDNPVERLLKPSDIAKAQAAAEAAAQAEAEQALSLSNEDLRLTAPSE